MCLITVDTKEKYHMNLCFSVAIGFCENKTGENVTLRVESCSLKESPAAQKLWVTIKQDVLETVITMLTVV